MPKHRSSRIYLDHAAATPIDPRALRAMHPYLAERFGNPGSLHSFGQEALAAVDRARETIARAAGADFRGVIFTASATEANNLALRGTVAQWRRERHETSDKQQEVYPRIVVSAIEHESVLETARALARAGEAEVVEIPVDRYGIVDLAKLRASLTPETALISVMYANNEVGTIQPITEIAQILRGYRVSTKDPKPHTPYPSPLFHIDAAQAFAYLPCRLGELGADLLTISSQKMCGPKGAGALIIGDTHTLLPVLTGGGQEFGFRSGTENVPAIVGFGEAVRIAESSRDADAKRVASLRERFVRGLRKIAPRLQVNGPAKVADRLPHIANLYLPGVLAEELITALDLAGIAISSGSACAARSARPSHVLRAMGQSDERARRSVRASFGRSTTSRDIDTALVKIKVILRSL